MKDDAIYAVFTSILVDALLDMKIVPPNSDDLPIKPYLTIDVVSTTRENMALDRGVERSEGFCQITLVSETNEDVNDVKAKAEEIAALFPHRFRSGDLLLTNPPMVEQGYRDNSDWRTPIRVDYRTDTQT